MKTTTKTESEPTQDSLEGNDYYEEQWKRFRKSYDIKNKYHDYVGKDSSFMDYKYEATTWNEPMLTTMHKTIRLQGHPKPIIPSGQPPRGNRRRGMKATKVQSDSGNT